MEKRQHALRSIVLKLNVSGTCEVLEEQRLYKGGYGFVKLQVYVPKTQNTEAPVLSAYCTTVDELGREKISTHNYRLLYVGEFTLDGLGYLLFERYLPKEFTETVTQPNGLKITLNYNDSAPTRDEAGSVLLDDNGVPKRHATDLLVSSRYMTTVYPGGWNDESMELDISDSEAAQIAENMRDIDDLQAAVEGVRSHIDDITEKAEQVVENTVKSTETKYQYGDSGTVPPSGEWSSEPPAPDGKEFFWSKTDITFVNGTMQEIYTVARKGDKGDQGERGDKGEKGDPGGKDGSMWYSGVAAPDGSTGQKGDFYLDTTTGNVYNRTESGWGDPICNLTGPQGKSGEDGAPGRNGSDGSPGEPGRDGENGTTFTPSVSEEGVLSWENDGNLPNPPTVTIKGKDGKDGTTFTPSVSDDGTLSWTNDGQKENPSPVNIMGPAGPVALVPYGTVFILFFLNSSELSSARNL